MENIRRREEPLWDLLYWLARGARDFTLPRSRILGRLLKTERTVRNGLWRWLKNQYCNQIMAASCTHLGHGIAWDGDVPMIFGDGEIVIGDRVRIGNRQTWVVGIKVFDGARLTIGDYSVINYQTLISAALDVTIGRHVLIGGRTQIFDNNSHPFDYVRRRRNAPMSVYDVAPVVIEDDVWIGTECLVMKGVHIGRCSVIGAGSVVTRDVPPFSVAAGNPARVVKQLRQLEVV